MKLSIKNAGKPLQMVTIDSLKTSSAPYSMVPSPTLYDLPFSHNTA